jgi:hypothetical protein
LLPHPVIVISDIEISEAGDYNFTLEPLPEPRREPLLVYPAYFDEQDIQAEYGGLNRP